MGQTVEFEYAIGETVEIGPLRYRNGGIGKVLGVVEAATIRGTACSYDVSYVDSGGVSCSRPFSAAKLAKILPSEDPGPSTRRLPQSECAPPESASASVFPRVIWQSGPVPTRLEEELGDDDWTPYRLVQVEACRFVDEVYGRDAMGARRWRALPPKHNADWLRNAIVEKLERQAETAKLRRQAEADENETEQVR